LSSVSLAIAPAIAVPGDGAVHVAPASAAPAARASNSTPDRLEFYLSAAPPIPLYLRNQRLLI
jgi:hypothetical protein